MKVCGSLDKGSKDAGVLENWPERAQMTPREVTGTIMVGMSLYGNKHKVCSAEMDVLKTDGNVDMVLVCFCFGLQRVNQIA